MSTENGATRRIRAIRTVFLALAWLLVLCIVLQTMLAGLAIFEGESRYWREHSIFVHLFQYIPLIMLVLAFFARYPRTMIGLCAGLLVLIVPLQYLTAHMAGLGALHPVIALLLFALSVRVAMRAHHLQRTGA